MSNQQKIDIDVFKAVTRAIAHSDDLDVMAGHLLQLLVGATGIKGCTLFALNHHTDELEILATFGLSAAYVNKGPVLAKKSLGRTRGSGPIVVPDITLSDQLQYPENALEEGIRAIVAVPVTIYQRLIGDLRLYHSRTWDISDAEIDSLMLLGEQIGLGMQYTRLLTAVRAVHEVIGAVHPVWLGPRHE